MDISNVSFDFNSMTQGQDVFSTKTEYATDTRFYNLEKDPKTGEGQVLVRFLPDGELKETGGMGTIQKMFRINVQDRASKQFVSEWSPSTIGLKDPFQERFSELWKEGKQDQAKKLGRAIRFITNIKVINDPKHPENNGKIFLFDMSQTLAEKIQKIQMPSEADRALGIQPKELFNPLNGYNYIIRSIKGSNGIINYDSSMVAEQPTSIYNSKEEAVKDITENCYKLSEFTRPEFYKSYEELKEKLDWIEGILNGTSAPQTTQAQVQTAQVQPQLMTDNTSSVQVQTAPMAQAQVNAAPTAPQFTQVQPQAQAQGFNVPNPGDELDEMIANLSK